MQRFSRLKMFDGFYWFHCSYQRKVSIFCGLYSSLGDVISKNKPAKKIFAQRYIKKQLGDMNRNKTRQCQNSFCFSE